MISIATNATRNNCEGSFLTNPRRDRIENILKKRIIIETTKRKQTFFDNT